MVVSIGWWTKSFHRKWLFFCKVLVWGSRLKMVVLTCWYLLSHMFKKMNPSKVTPNISPNVGGHFLSFPKGHVNSPSQKGHGLNHLECFFLTQCCVFFNFEMFFLLGGPKKKLLRIENREISTLQGDFILWRSWNFEAEQKSARFGSPRTRSHFGIYFVGWFFTDSKPWDKAVIKPPFLSAENLGNVFLSNQQAEKSKLLVYVYLLSLIWSQYKKRRINPPRLFRRKGLWTPPCRTRGTSTRSCREGPVALWVGVEF